MKFGVSLWCMPLLLAAMLGANAQTQTAGSAVYRCPGKPVLYTDAISAK